MLLFLNSDFFSTLCSYLQYDEDITRTSIMAILHNPERAKKTAQIMNMNLRIPQ
jgi:hypothetical protein